MILHNALGIPAKWRFRARRYLRHFEDLRDPRKMVRVVAVLAVGAAFWPGRRPST